MLTSSPARQPFSDQNQEWRNHLRSALHPALFAVAYKAADVLASSLQLSPSIRADILLAAPKIIQACIAALGDYYTYKLAKHVYGKESQAAWITLLLTIGSAWQWFCATRTFSNCAETTLTIVALYNWPFHWALGTDEVGFQIDEKSFLRIRQTDEVAEGEVDEAARFRRALLCAATAIILRPTNVVIWMTIVIATYGRGMWYHNMVWDINTLITESFLCGGTVLTLSALVDRVFYGVWAFPPWNFLKFNVLQSLAVFYGNNNWHYYLTQGYPLLLTVAIVPAMIGLYQSLVRKKVPEALSIQSRLTLHRLGLISVVLPAFLSILSHKEVRFVHPILPALHILAAMPVARFWNLVDAAGRETGAKRENPSGLSKLVLFGSVALNVGIGSYTSLVHSSGVISITDYFRSEFEAKQALHESPTGSNLTFAVFMPCHSLPWRSHLQYPASETHAGISGWALTCEPPLNLNLSAKAAYLDEADLFYLDPIAWVNKHMSRDIAPAPTHKPGVYASERPNSWKSWTNPGASRGVWINEGQGGHNSTLARKRRAWPEYVVFFEHLEPVMRRVLSESAYRECKRFLNSHGHDDWRRKGDVVIWCVKP